MEAQAQEDRKHFVKRQAQELFNLANLEERRSQTDIYAFRVRTHLVTLEKEMKSKDEGPEILWQFFKLVATRSVDLQTVAVVFCPYLERLDPACKLPLPALTNACLHENPRAIQRILISKRSFFERVRSQPGRFVRLIFSLKGFRKFSSFIIRFM